MKQEYIAEARKMAKDCGFDDVKREGVWNGCVVLSPTFTDDEFHCIGTPMYLLFKDGKIRWSKPDGEGMKIFDFFLK